MAWNWYGVKTLYRTTVVGEPVEVDRYYDPEATLVEERVVLFRARNFDEALAKAEAEARRYAQGERWNRYGQKIRQRYLGAANAYWMFDSPGQGVEVFSLIEQVPQTVSDLEIRRQRMGRENPRAAWRRARLMQREFVSALGRRAQ